MTVGIVLTCDPRYVAQLIQELAGLNQGSENTVLGSGVIYVPSNDSDLHKELLLNTPIFLRHMFPVEVVNTLDGGVTDALSYCVAFASERLKQHPVPQNIAVQCRILDDSSLKPRDVKAGVDLWLQDHGHVPTVKDPQFIISACITTEAVYLGLSTPTDNLTSWSGGAVHYRASENSLSRAGHKLEEAIEVLGIDLDNVSQALDLGAAPGGWTNLLLSKGIRVTAVDTGMLSPVLKEHPKLTFLNHNAFDLKIPADSFHLLTCDMSWDPQRTAHLMNELAPTLKPGGQVVLTVKFMGGRPLTIINRCLALLSQEYTYIRGRHLWHNREEVTLYLKRS